VRTNQLRRKKGRWEVILWKSRRELATLESINDKSNRALRGARPWRLVVIQAYHIDEPRDRAWPGKLSELFRAVAVISLALATQSGTWPLGIERSPFEESIGGGVI
jgi:hypothetical protein